MIAFRVVAVWWLALSATTARARASHHVAEKEGGGMAKGEGRMRLTKRVLDAAEPGAKTVKLWDDAVTGFHVRVLPSGRRAYYFRFRTAGGRAGAVRDVKIGDFPTLTVDTARDVARRWAAEVAQGGDPATARAEAKAAPTMAELFERYLAEHARVRKKKKDAREDERLIAQRLAPTLGRLKVADVTGSHVSKLHAGMAETPVRANRALAVLSKSMNLAEQWGWRPQGSNPCRFVKKYREEPRRRYLTEDELQRVGEALLKAEKGELGHVTWQSIAFVRLSLFSGMRKGEILSLKWEYIEAEKGRCHLPTSKTGFKTVQLSPLALSLLGSLPRMNNNPYVLTGHKIGSHIVNVYKNGWLEIRKEAKLENFRIHDIRHSYASEIINGGESLSVVQHLLGHTQITTTQRYAHLLESPLKQAAEKATERIQEKLNRRPRS